MSADVADRPAEPRIHSRQVAWDGYRRVEAVDAEMPGQGGRPATRRVYEVMHIGAVAAVLPYDPRLGCLVVIRQFRVGAHLAHGHGLNLEVIAGRVDPGEDVAAAARRETMEEAGLTLDHLEPMLDYAPLPAAADERVHLFLGRCDASRLPAVAGLLAEDETIEPIAVAPEALLAAAEAGQVRNGHLLLALSWFTLHRQVIEARWKTP